MQYCFFFILVQCLWNKVNDTSISVLPFACAGALRKLARRVTQGCARVSVLVLFLDDFHYKYAMFVFLENLVHCSITVLITLQLNRVGTAPKYFSESTICNLYQM